MKCKGGGEGDQTNSGARSWLQWVFCKLLTARRSRTSHGIVAGRASDRGRNRCPDRRRGLPAQFSGSPRPNLPPQFALHDADVGIGPVSEAEARRNFEKSRDSPLLEQKAFRDFLLCH